MKIHANRVITCYVRFLSKLTLKRKKNENLQTRISSLGDGMISHSELPVKELCWNLQVLTHRKRIIKGVAKNNGDY